MDYLIKHEFVCDCCGKLAIDKTDNGDCAECRAEARELQLESIEADMEDEDY